MPRNYPLIALGGVISATVANVTLYLNTETEEQYIRTVHPFDPCVLKLAVARAKDHGYEPMDEWEESEGGLVTTHWLEQVFFVPDEIFTDNTTTTEEREALA